MSFWACSSSRTLGRVREAWQAPLDTFRINTYDGAGRLTQAMHNRTSTSGASCSSSGDFGFNCPTTDSLNVRQFLYAYDKNGNSYKDSIYPGRTQAGWHAAECVSVLAVRLCPDDRGSAEQVSISRAVRVLRCGHLHAQPVLRLSHAQVYLRRSDWTGGRNQSVRVRRE
jgi:hypothetical protein